jgi:4-hydroxybenzoate polyprenyltransferase/phosphoserine phosphatase
MNSIERPPTPARGAPPAAVPLVVDLDGTLLRSDLLVESALGYWKKSPFRLPLLARWLLGGKANLKGELAQLTDLDPANLPYDERVLALLTQAQAEGQPLVLATASHRSLAEKVATHLGCFSRVMATEGTLNLEGKAKRDALVEAFGAGGYDYVGNSSADLPAWESARRAWVVNATTGVEQQARRLASFTGSIAGQQAGLAGWARALRLHQWLKNSLIFVPIFGAHRWSEAPLWLTAGAAFLAFGLCASSVYILNDLLDLPDDRRHARKRNRPFASGLIPVTSGILAVPLLLTASIALAAFTLPALATGVLGFYYCVTLAYSLSLKRKMAIDVIALAGLYTLRLVMGAAATGLALSFWLLSFSMFMFLSLALVKRYAELFHARQRSLGAKTPGRGYFPEDLPIVASLGTAAGYLAVLVLAFYINDPHTLELYRRPEVIWLSCPLVLSWITRVWMLTHRGEMHEDPLVFATKDWKSLTTALLLGITLIAAR